MARGISVDFTANTAKFTRDVEGAGAAMDKFGGKADKVSKALSAAFKGIKIAGTAAAAAGAAVIYATNKYTTAARDIGDMSTRLGISTEALSELGYVARQSGTTLQEMGGWLEEMGENISEAGIKSGAARDALAELGLTVSDLASLSPERQFELIATQMDKLATAGDKTRIAWDLFGESSTGLLQVIEGGGPKVRALREEFERMGGSLTGEQAQAAKEYEQTWAKMAESFDIARDAIGKIAVGPLTTLGGVLNETVIPALRELLQLLGLLGETRLESLNGEIERLEDELAKLDQVEANAIRRNRRSRGGSGQENEIVRQYTSARESLQAAVAALKAERENLKTQLAEPLISDRPLGPPGGGRTGRGDPAKTAAAREAQEFARDLASLEDQLDPVSAKTREYLANVELLNRAWQETGNDKYIDLLNELATDTDSLRESEEALADERARAISLIKEFDPTSGIADAIAEVERLRQKFPELDAQLAEVSLRMGERWDQIGKDAQDSADTAEQAWRDLGATFESSFEKAIVEGENLREVLRGLEQDIIRIITRQLITKPLATGITNTLQGAGGGLFGDFFANLFKAEGGPVSAGQTYIVGEKGPELFVPKNDGTILPNGTALVAQKASTNSNVTNINISMSNMSGDDVRRSAGQVATTAARAVNRAQRRNM